LYRSGWDLCSAFLNMEQTDFKDSGDLIPIKAGYLVRKSLSYSSPARS